jgi:hypothetical protein
MKAKFVLPVALLLAALAVSIGLIRTGRELQPSQPQAAPLGAGQAVESIDAEK